MTTRTRNGQPETASQLEERILAEQRIRNKHLTDTVYQEAEDGAVWVLLEAEERANNEISRWRAANGVIVTATE